MQLKKILLLSFICCLAVISARSQFMIDSRYYSNINSWYNWQGGRFINNLNIPKVQATTGRDTGAIRYALADSSVYVWTGSQWRALGGGGTTYTPGVGIKIDGSTIRFADTISQNHTIYIDTGFDFYLRGGTATNFNRLGVGSINQLYSENTVTGRYTEIYNNSTAARMRNFNAAGATADVAVYGGYGNMNSFSSGNNTNLNVYPGYWELKTDDTGFPTTLGMDLRGNKDSITVKTYSGTDLFSFYSTFTRAYKPVKYKVYDSSGYDALTLIPKQYLEDRLAGVSGETILNNVGTGYDVAVQGTDNVKRLQAGWGIDLDSATANVVKILADTAQLATSTAVRDTAQALRYIISGESVAWGTYAQRVALTGMVAGQRFYQTNERVGNWFYDGSEWVHHPPVSAMKQSSQWFPGALSTSTSGAGAAAAYSTVGTTFKMSGGFAYLSTGSTTTGSAAVYATRTSVAGTTMPADSANNGYKIVLVGKIAIPNAPTGAEDFRLNFGTRNIFSTTYNDSTGSGYVFSIANYRNSSFIQCYTSSRTPALITTTTSVPISSAVFSQVSGYSNDLTPAFENFITLVLVYNTRHCDYYINGTLVASHALSGTRANDQGFNDWVFSIVKSGGTTNRNAFIESVYSYYIKDNF